MRRSEKILVDFFLFDKWELDIFPEVFVCVQRSVFDIWAWIEYMYHWILQLVRLNTEAAYETSKTEIQISRFRSNVFQQASLSLRIFLPLISPKYKHLRAHTLGTNISHPKAGRWVSFPIGKMICYMLVFWNLEGIYFGTWVCLPLATLKSTSSILKQVDPASQHSLQLGPKNMLLLTC